MHTPSRALANAPRTAQRGWSLLEVMVGLSIGSLVSATAIALLLGARQLNATTTELAHMQQQAAYVFRVLGQQIRQAGGRALQDPASATTWATLHQQPSLHALWPITGTQAPSATEYALTLQQQNTNHKLYTAQAGVWEHKPLLRNCLAENPGVDKAVALRSSFKLHNGHLVCAGTAAAQVLLPDVTDLQVRYLLASDHGPHASLQYVQAPALSSDQAWQRIRGVEVCLEITSPLPTPAHASTYRTCNGALAARDTRWQLVFRTFYHTPSQLWTLGP